LKLGLNSAILPDCSFKEVIDICSGQGLPYVEICCWPVGGSDRRYAGVTHIDIDRLNEDSIEDIKKYLQIKDVSISALAYYPNLLDSDRDKAKAAAEHLKNLIRCAPLLNVHHVNTFIGRDKNKTVRENLDMVKSIWPEILEAAETYQVDIGIENCPMYFTEDEWPGGCNLASSPWLWDEIFSILPSPRLGLNYDPSHLLLQGMDYIQPIYDYQDRIFHAHIKDLHIHKDRIDRYGRFAYPSQYSSPKLPGLGDIDWGAYMSALYDIQFDGAVCIELEDKNFETSEADVRKAIEISVRFMRQFI